MNEIKTKNRKNSLGATWNASHLAVRLCALRHWKRVSMPPTTQSLHHPLTRASHVAPRIKTASNSQRILHGRDAILRVRDKWLIFNMILQLWADVKYHVPTGFFAEGERFLSFWRCHRPHWGGRRWCCGVADSSICLKSDCHSTNDRCEALASLKGCFFMFLFQSPSIFPLNRYFHMGQKK